MSQNVPITKSVPVVEQIPIPWTELSPQQQMFVDYSVLQGTITEDDGQMHKMTVEEFAHQIGVDRRTLSRWKRSIPNFWDLVNERRKLVNTSARLAKVWNALFLAATVKLDTRAIQTYLANTDPSFRMPHQKMEHEAVGGLADLLDRARMRSDTNIIEAEVVDATPHQTTDA